MTVSSDFRDFEQLFDDLNYRQAEETLRQIINRLDLTPRERQGLETELAGLEQLLHKLTNQVVQIAVFGLVGRGSPRY